MAAAMDGTEYLELQIDHFRESFARASNAESVQEDEDELLWEAISRLPSQRRGNFALLRRSASEYAEDGSGKRTETIDVTRLDRANRELVVKKALATNAQDNHRLLSGIKERLDRVGLEVPKIEVRFERLNVVGNVRTGSRALPTLINVVRDTFEDILTGLRIFRLKKHSLTILNDISGAIKPGRMTLLLGPPGSGKSTLLLALAGKLDKNLKRTGSITYNGHKLDHFYVRRTSAYISQIDNHIAELTVRETLDFAASCQGASEGFAAYMKDLIRLEKEQDIRPSPEIDAFMKASSVAGKKHSVSTDYVLKVLGLDVCAETVVGSDMLRGVSGGQRKRVTTGEMIVGPRKTLLMDEISTGLDSSTTYQIVKCIGNFVHQMDGTVLMALLQPPPETFDLFDDLVLLSEGYMVYQGPRAEVLEFFESLGFRLPPRKGVADFLQEVTSKKDQAQYWDDHLKPYAYIPVPEIAKAFKSSRWGRSVESMVSVPFDKTKDSPSALAKTEFAVPRWELLKACFAREVLLIRRHWFLYIFRTLQVFFVGCITSTIFLRTRLHPTDEINGNLYLSCLFFGLVHMMFNGFSELSLLIFRLPVFFKQRDNLFHPGWAWSIVSFILRIPYSAVEAFVWSCVVYYSVDFTPEISRFFRFMFLLFTVHQMALGLFRTMASIARDMVIANTFGSAALLVVFLLGGFIIPKESIKPWWIWAYWVSPLTYGQRALSVNEFGAERWRKISTIGNNTIGYNVLHGHSLPTSDNWYWIGVGMLWLYALVFNIIVTLALTYLNPLQKAKTVADPVDSTENVSAGNSDEGLELNQISSLESNRRKGMILPFQPLTMTFHNVNYFVDMPKEMSKQGVPEKKLQLLSNVSGVFSPGVLTALVGASGAGKTTLMDVLAGRKTGGYIEGDIKISGYPKEQGTFSRISGYVEQNDIHSPQVTVEESLWFSSSLRLPKDVTKEQRHEFVEEVMRLVELDTLRQALVGFPGSSGLSTEQRKRLTIAVELVANPSIIFMDEPTSGLDARAAAIVMRTVRNTVDTGRTLVCTIHQPSIDIFEAFDELLLMKRGGQVIYGGKLGGHSQIMIDYFQRIKGVPPISEGYNPATWMLEVTTAFIEEKIGDDFAEIYSKSEQYREVEASIMHFSTPPVGSEPLKFSSTYAQDLLSQFQICLKKENLVYWRSPRYNAVRIFFTVLAAFILGSVFWKIGSKRDTTQDLFVVMGALYSACMFLGVNNASSVQPIVSIERTVFYREKAAGMYSPLAYAAAQGLVEVPYIILQTILYGLITYFMIGFEKTAGKFFLYLLFMFLTFTYFTFYGMMAVGLTPSQHMAAVISSAFYSLWNLLSGFLIPMSKIPGWWIWFYYICPIAWTLRGVISSQLGDVEDIIVGPGFKGTVKEYLKVNFGFESNMIGVSVAVLFAFCFLFFSVFAFSAKVLNFQRR
ncbi:ABC transporter G family member 31 [Ricinus communis]|uniref:ATP-binding cassette transporter, putative n=1 Tax=Ricinus communis TaxID=3988 RepID=B9SI18_RICCO|nr:ABC transporter G family member 31 [Ricinus communis]EEF36755.1 ATP-binding cassette transporter, putative [Ricinus communis]|eukprot:XP_002525637.1 ABC transporter G family member 31 [Ricinus communis]